MANIAVIYLGRRGGGAVYSYEMAKALIANNQKVFVFVSANAENIQKWKELNTEMIEIIPTADSTFDFITATLKFRLFAYGKLKRKYRDMEIDACYIPMGHVWDDYIIQLFPKAKLIYTEHDPVRHSSDLTFKNTIIRLGTKILNFGIKHKMPSDIVILSKIFFETIEEKYPIKEEHIHVIPHGIFDYYKNEGSGNSFNYDKEKVDFLFWGRITGYKGLDVLAKAFALLKSKTDMVTLTVVGSGDFSAYSDVYEQLSDVTIVNRWIKDEEVASFFNSDARVILVLPYKDATQSGVIPIAMDFGIPVIASNTGGLSEQIENGRTGYLVEPNNPELLAECMWDVMNSDTTTIEKQAKEYIKKLDWKVLSRNIIQIVC